MNGLHDYLARNEKPGWKLHIRNGAIIHMAIKSLTAKKLRSALTIIGVAIGTGSVFLLLSFGLGLQALVAKQVTEGQSINTIDVNNSGSQVLKMTGTTVGDIAAIRNVKAVSGYYAKASKLAVGGAAADVVTYGVDKLYVQTGDFVMRAGKMLEATRTDQIVVSGSILDAAGVADSKQMINKPLTLKVKLSDDTVIDKKFTVVGVLSSGGGSEAFISSKVFESSGAKEFVGIKVLVNDRQNVSGVRHAIEGLGFSTTSPVDTLEQVDQFFRILRIILVSFGAIGMIIAVLGMINTLTVSLLERTKEVALMLALGARPRDINLLFIIEAIILSLVGGVVGIISALLVSVGADIVLNAVARSRGAVTGFTVFSSPPWLVLAALLIMTGIGYIVAFVPARRAARINSIEVLRRD